MQAACTLADIDIDKTVFVYQIHHLILFNDVWGKPPQRGLNVFITRHWVIHKIIFYVCAKNWVLRVEIIILKMIFDSKRDAARALESPGLTSLSPPTVRRTR